MGAVDTVLADETLTARKPHICDHCGKLIEAGQEYQRLRGIWDGTPGVFKSHPDCRRAAAKMHKMKDLLYDEGVLLMSDVEQDDHEWLLAEFPAVAGRLGIATP